MKLLRITALALASAASIAALGGAASAQTISVYFGQIYSPEATPASKEVMDDLVSQFEALHPGVNVELIPFMGGDQTSYYAWLTTRFSGGDEPDIAWSHWYDRNAQRDRWLPLNDYLQTGNQYVPEGQPGHDKWADQFQQNVMAQIRASDGNWYQVNTNWVETGLFVNEDKMAELGLPTEWENWTQFIDTCKALREKGVQPLALFTTPGWSTYQWLDTLLISAAFADKLESWHLPQYENPYMTDRQLTLEELTKAAHDGSFSTADPRFDTFLDLTQEVISNCVVDGYAGMTDLQQMMNLFLNGTTPMAWLGTWNADTIRQTVTFTAKTTYFPPMTSENSPYLAEPTMYRVGGPSSGGQFGLSVSTVDRGTADIAVDFLKFITAPQNYQRIANYDVGLLPVINGVEPAEVAKGFITISQLPERGIGDAVSRFGGEEYGTPHNRMMQSFTLGEMSREELKAEYQALLDSTVERLCEDNEWAWCAE
jgi:ABC-type glycerol-3-phosphate transport system substrate-binding protein